MMIFNGGRGNPLIWQGGGEFPPLSQPHIPVRPYGWQIQRCTASFAILWRVVLERILGLDHVGHIDTEDLSHENYMQIRLIGDHIEIE